MNKLVIDISKHKQCCLKWELQTRRLQTSRLRTKSIVNNVNYLDNKHCVVIIGLNRSRTRLKLTKSIINKVVYEPIDYKQNQ